MLLLAAGPGRAHAQMLYSALTGTATTQTGVSDYLQVLTLPQGGGTYSLSSFTVGVNFTSGTTDQGVIVYLYSGVDTSPTSADALANATLLGGTGLSGTLVANGPGSFTYTFPITSPFTFTISTGTIGVETLLLDNTFQNYSTDANSRFSTTLPTTGSALSQVYFNPNEDSTFPGADQTAFGQSAAYNRFALTGTFAVPEPGTWAMIAIGVVFFAGHALRRRRACLA